jgi:hypothetical protein
MSTATAQQTELENNYREFEKLLPTFLPQEHGKFVLMRRGQKVNVFDSAKDAVIFAEAQFKDGIYSVQQITIKTVDLGYFSHAVPNGGV